MYFNPRPHEEGDGKDLSIIAIDDGIVISIHALMKRATVGDTVNKGDKLDFNPRPHEEGDLNIIYLQ